MRVVFWHYQALNLFKKIRSYTLIKGTLNLTVTLLCVLRISITLYLISGIKSAFLIFECVKCVMRVKCVKRTQIWLKDHAYVYN